jgi:hypothetical protein
MKGRDKRRARWGWEGEQRNMNRRMWRTKGKG